MGTSRTTSLSTKDVKYPIMVTIKTKQIKQYVFKRSMLRQNMIRLYGIILGQCLPTLQSELEGNPVYSTHSPTYECLWILTKIKMCTSVIGHKYNGYYYEFMVMRVILCLRQGQDETTEAYYWRFEASISTYELEKCTATTHVELNKTYITVNQIKQG